MQAATNLRLELTSKLTPEASQVCLGRLVDGHWLATTGSDGYGLGVRTELQRRFTTDESPATQGEQLVEG